MINLDIYQPGEIVPDTNIITTEGDARGGKGTCANAIATTFTYDGYRAITIEQGYKFRGLAYLAIEHGVDIADEAKLRVFLEDESTRGKMVGLLAHFATLPMNEIKNILYASDISSASGRVGKRPEAHPLAIGVMNDQVAEAAANGVDVVIIDGRAMEAHANRLHTEKVGLHVLSLYFRCDALAAARRTLGEHRSVHELTAEEQLDLFAETARIFERNKADATRTTEPQRFPTDAYNLDMLKGLPKDAEDREAELTVITRKGVVLADTTYVGIEPMVTPVVAIARAAVAQATVDRADRLIFDANPSILTASGSVSAFTPPRRLIL
jgi:cytidylate kinase